MMIKNNAKKNDFEKSIYFTSITKKNGIITKEIRKALNGVLDKDSSKCWFSEGTGEVIEIQFSEFGDFLTNVKKNQAIVHGIPKEHDSLSEPFKILSEKNFKDQPKTITRTKKHFEFPENNALLMLDYDPDPGSEYLNPEELITRISDVFPQISDCAKVINFSTSSFIYDKAGDRVDSGKPGYHIYLVAKSGSDISRFNEVLFKRSTLEGHAYVFITKSGGQIVRTIFDKIVNSPERIDFVAGADCFDGLTQKLPAPEYQPGGVLDTELLLDLTPEEQVKFEEKVKNLKQKTIQKSTIVKDNYIKKETKKLISKGIPADRSKKIIESRQAKILMPGDWVSFDNCGIVDVGEILVNPEKFDDETLADPLEPDYGGGRNKAKFYANFENGGNPIIHSFAHGGQSFRLQNDWTLQLAKELIEKKLKRGKLTTDFWSKVVILSDFGPADEEEFLNFLIYKKVGTKKELRDNLKKQKLKFENQKIINEIKKEAKHPIIFSQFDISKAAIEADNYMALCAGKTQWGYYNFSDNLSFITKESPNKLNSLKGKNYEPPEITLLRQYLKTTLRTTLENSTTFLKKNKAGKLQKIPVPDQVIDTILNHPESKAPKIEGQVNHPFVGPDGAIVKKSGLDKKTGIFVNFDDANFMQPSTEISINDAISAFNRLKHCIFSEFEWENEELDPVVAVAFLLTTIQRKILETAPGIEITSPDPGSGKTTLARVVHLTTTGCDMPVSTLNTNANESKKEIFAILLQSPEIICFDNISDGTEINDPVIAKIITSPFFQDRILGVSQMVKVPTNSTIVLTGNNISLGSDLIRRFARIGLRPSSANPENRKFENPDVKLFCLEHRMQNLTDAITVIKGYRDAGSPLSTRNIQGSGFPGWDLHVRLPLLWVSGVDVNDAIRLNVRNSRDVCAMTAVYHSLVELFGEKEFRANDVLKKINKIEKSSIIEEEILSLAEGVEGLIGEKKINANSIGMALKRMESRIFDGLRLCVSRNKKKGNFYRIEKIDKQKIKLAA
jgi:hypothetical protein